MYSAAGVPNRFGASERALCCNCFAVGACIERFHGGGWKRENECAEKAKKRRDDGKKGRTEEDKEGKILKRKEREREEEESTPRWARGSL